MRARLDTGDDVLAREDVRAALAARHRRCADQAAAFAGEVVLVAAMPDVAADPLLAEPIVDRGVDVIDPGVEHGIEDCLRLAFGNFVGTRGAAQPHRPVAEHRDPKPGSSQFSLWQTGH
jgi:hypothetical protein